MSEWTPEMELALEAYATFEEQGRWLSDSEHERIGWMRAALAEIRRLREELRRLREENEKLNLDMAEMAVFGRAGPSAADERAAARRGRGRRK